MLYQQQKKNKRQEKILLSLDELVYATREQLQIVNGLGGDRNAQRILKRMENEKIINSVRYEKKIYYLSNRGKEQIGSKQGDLKKSWITHTLMRNDLFIKLGMPEDWKKEMPVTWGDNKLIPDATFKKASEYYFVEIDNQQTMKANYDKIKKYKDLSKVIFENYNHTPTVIWSTTSKIRGIKIKEACQKQGLKHIIYNGHTE